MSHQLCQNCGSNQFEHIDGRLYCVVCQSQNISMQVHVSFANEGSGQLGRRVHNQSHTTATLDETTPKIEIFEANETTTYRANTTDETIPGMDDLTVDDNEQPGLEQHVWTSFEAYSYILEGQVQAILRLDYVKKDKHDEFLECTFLLYLRYLAANGILDTSQSRSSVRQEQRRLTTNHRSKVNYADRFSQFAKLNTHVLNKTICTLDLDILIGLLHW